MNRMPGKAVCVLSLVLAVATGVANAQTTGEVKGQVKDDQGEALPGVLVNARGSSLVGERAVTTDKSGRFHLAVLPPGEYSLKFTFPGHQAIEITQIVVRLGGTTRVEATLRSGDPVETVIVTMPPPPLIDTTGTDNVVNFTSSTLDTMPTSARDYRDITKYVPSITGVELNTLSGRANGFPSIRGEGQEGDNYTIDGLTVREPSDKTTATPLPLNVIDEVQIITDGFSPEYGQALGGTVNVITKSGTNDFDGEVAYLYTSDALSNNYQETFLATPTDFDAQTPYISFGGPIVKDKLRFYLSYNRSDTEDTFAPTSIAGFGTLPEGLLEDSSNTYFGKLSWAITPNHAVSLNYTYRDRETTGLNADKATPEARSGLDIQDDRWRLNYQAIFSPNSVLEVRLGHVSREENNIPVSPRDAAQYEFSDFGIVTNNAGSLTQFKTERTDAALVYTHYWNPGGRAGHHEFKGGFEYHEPEQTSYFEFTGTGEDVFAISPVGAPDPGQPDRFNGGSKFLFKSVEVTPGQIIQVPTVLNEFFSTPALENHTEEQGFFVQDRWEIGRVNLLLGVRWDKAKGYNNENVVFTEYDWDRAIAPRFSLSWDVTGDGKNVVKTGWGRFTDTASTRFGEFGNTAISFAFRFYTWTGMESEDFRDHIDDGSSLDIHDPDNWGYSHEQSNAATPTNYEDVKSPARVDRFVIEYDRKLWDNYAVKVRYVNGASRQLIDDVFDPFPNFRVTNTDLKRRDYDSYELEFNGNPTPNTTFRTSYVHSMAKGTNPGQFETGGFLSNFGSGNEIGVFLDRPKSSPQLWCKVFDDPGTPAQECSPYDPTDPTVDFNGDDVVDQFDFDMFLQNLFGGLGSIDGDIEGWYGYLPYSVDDQVKLYGKMNIPKWGDMYVSTFVQWFSGYHTERQGFQAAYGGYLTFSEVPVLGTQCADPNTPTFATCAPTLTKTPVPGQNFSSEDGQRRGTIENGAFWSVDLSVGKVWVLSKKLSLETRAELFNLFNEQEPLSINDQAVSSFGEPLTRQRPRSARLFLRFSF